jgi:uncharacterized membrane protein
VEILGLKSKLESGSGSRKTIIVLIILVVFLAGALIYFLATNRTSAPATTGNKADTTTQPKPERPPDNQAALSGVELVGNPEILNVVKRAILENSEALKEQAAQGSKISALIVRSEKELFSDPRWNGYPDGLRVKDDLRAILNEEYDIVELKMEGKNLPPNYSIFYFIQNGQIQFKNDPSKVLWLTSDYY